MHEDKWKDTVAMVKSKFTVLADGKEQIEDIPNATREFVEFDSPTGRMRLEYVVRPAVLDKKTTYSKHGGAASDVQYVYSKDDFVRRMEAFSWNEAAERWEELKAPAL